MQKETARTINNTAMLYILTIAKMIFPLITLPYLTRILSKDCYGMVSYVKSCMVYVQLIIDFGFLLSSVRDIVKAKNDIKKIGVITGNTFVAKTFLLALAAIVLVVMAFTIEILRLNLLFTFLSFIAVALSAYLADFLFRGIEKMHIIAIVYSVMKGISTALTFVFVNNDTNVLWIPILDIIGTAVAVGITWCWILKLKIKVKCDSIKRCLAMLKDSFNYFISNMATTAFGALNTFLIGICITDIGQVAYWSVCMQIISAIQNLYTPIINGIYPQMVREKNLRIIHKVLLIFMPIVIIGCGACFFLAKFALFIVGGEKYVDAYILFRWLIPILLFSFPGMLYGWPTLGAIDKVKETSLTTIITAIVQVTGLGLLILTDKFTLINIAILRGITELLMMVMRMSITYKNKKLFLKTENCDEDC